MPAVKHQFHGIHYCAEASGQKPVCVPEPVPKKWISKYIAIQSGHLPAVYVYKVAK